MASRGAILSSLTLLVALATGNAALAASGAQKYLDKPDGWFSSDESKRIAANILSHQSELGGWPKNVDTTAGPFRGDPRELKPSFDNEATTDELRYLARIYRVTKDDQYRKAVERGVEYILEAQYPRGGWPQSYPPPRTYHRHITYNDHAMVRIMELLRETYTSGVFDFLGDRRHVTARRAFDAGIACILKCQIKVADKLTVWCAQHDEEDYRPRPGRSYELVSLSGAESVGIVRLLMSLEKPAPGVEQAVEGAVAWFEAAKLKGIRVVLRDDARAPRGKDRVVVKDASAPPMWARFYEIGTNRPIFADRDGVAKYELADIGYERRNAYAWLGYWPQKLLDDEYPAWRKKRHGSGESRK